jgi:DNA-binding MarR family transcriptional regulator
MAAHKPNEELTTTEKNALIAYRDHLERFGAPPTLRWIAKQVGVVHSAAGYLMKRLREKGYMQEKKVTATRLVLSQKGKKAPL